MLSRVRFLVSEFSIVCILRLAKAGSMKRAANVASWVKVTRLECIARARCGEANAASRAVYRVERPHCPGKVRGGERGEPGGVSSRAPALPGQGQANAASRAGRPRTPAMSGQRTVTRAVHRAEPPHCP